LVCPSKDSNEQVEYEGRIFEGIFETVVFSIFMRLLADDIVSTTKKISTAARILKTRAARTIKPDLPLLTLPPPAA